MPVRVLIVDDSALVRKALTDALSTDPDIEVVGSAIDPYVARDKILQLEPDVLTLDIEMPRMDGLTFLKVLMKHRPMPVIVMSSLTTKGSQQALEALSSGAFDVVAKPSGTTSITEDTARLIQKIKAAARCRIRSAARAAARIESSERNNPTPPPGKALNEESRRYPPRALILIGASTGGTEAIRTVLSALPADLPPIVIVQHIPAQFSLAFANRLNDLCRMEVREAKEGDVLRPGLALVAPGGFHLVARWAGGHYVAGLNSGPPLHHQRPAVDVLFDSALRAGAGRHMLAVILTGMGSDGASGMLNLHRAGTPTLAQDEESCVVFGMPREAIALGAVDEILPLDQIASAINRFARSMALPRA